MPLHMTIMTMLAGSVVLPLPLHLAAWPRRKWWQTVSAPHPHHADGLPHRRGADPQEAGGMPSVKSLEFNLMQRVLTVVHAPNALEPVLEAVRSLGFQPEVPDASGQLAAVEEPKKPWWPLALAGWPRSHRKR
jgi:hypothetical protein